MPGQVIGKTDQPCFSLLMLVEGRVDALTSLPEKSEAGHNQRYELKASEKVRSYTAGESFGEECFEDDEYNL